MTELSDRLNFYVIILDRSVDRMKRFVENFRSFPIPYIRVSAIEGRNLTIPVKDYDALMFFIYTGRDALPGEIGCFLSHIKVLRMFLESEKEFAFICEDDAMPISESHEAIEQAISRSRSWDLLRLFGGRFKTSFPYQSLTSNHSLCTSITGMVATAGYIVNRHAAEILVKRLLPMTSLYDCALFHGRVGVMEATVYPDCILRNEFSNTSTIDYGVKRNLKPWHLIFWSCRFYRLWARIVRYSLQLYRMIKRRYSKK